MRLTLQNNPATIKRYANVRPARIWSGRRCGVKCPGLTRNCTLAKGHRGPHIAHAFPGRVVAVWDSGPALESGGGTGRLAPGARAQQRLRMRNPEGFVEAVWRRTRSVVSSPEDVAFIALFVIMVWFAVDTALRILGVR